MWGKRAFFLFQASVWIIFGLSSESAIVLQPAFVTYGKSCVRDSQCDTNNFIRCNRLTGQCDCLQGTQWNRKVSACLQLEGQSCSKFGPICTTNSSCFAGKCVCDPDFLPAGFGQCHLTYNEPCDEDHPCSWRHLLECPKPINTGHHLMHPHQFHHAVSSSGILMPQEDNDARIGGGQGTQRLCRCIRQHEDFVWDLRRNKCVSLVGRQCENIDSSGILDDSKFSADVLECVTSAFCDEGVCKCRAGYSATPFGHCALRYGETCDNWSNKLCNKWDFLNCQDGKCGCEYYQQMTYDQISGGCRLLIGEPCKTGNKTDNPEAENRWHRCVQNAECVSSRAGSMKGKCACLAGFKVTEDKLCEYVLDLDDDDLTKKISRKNSSSLMLRSTPSTSTDVNQMIQNLESSSASSTLSHSNSVSTDLLTTTDCDSSNLKNLEDMKTVHSNRIEIDKCLCSLLGDSTARWSKSASSCQKLVGSTCTATKECVDSAYCDDTTSTCICYIPENEMADKTCSPPQIANPFIPEMDTIFRKSQKVSSSESKSQHESKSGAKNNHNRSSSRFPVPNTLQNILFFVCTFCSLFYYVAFM